MSNKEENFMSTCMWQEERGKSYYRFQTDEPSVAAKMKRRKTFRQCSWGINCKHWIFVTTYSSPQKARKALAILTGCPVQKDSEDGLYFA